jgi:hypothetical protein
MRASHVLIGLALTLSWAGCASAEPSRFRNGTLGVLNARTLVNAPTSPFRSDQDLIFVLRQHDAGLRTRRIRARIFSLAAGARRPASWAEFDPCLIFHSTLINVRFGSQQVNLGGLGIGFLNAWGSNLSNGRYLVVFEERGDTDHLVRLNRADVDAYFQRGVIFEVQAARSYGIGDIYGRAAQMARGIQRVTQDVRDNSSAHVCYRYRQAAVEGGLDGQLAQALCQTGEVPS